MKRPMTQCLGFALLAAATASTAFAQAPAPPGPPLDGRGPLRIQERRLAPPNPTLDFMGGEVPVGPIVRGAPFSAEGVTTVSQTLGDGTRIERTVTAKLYRDGDGRVRREQTVLGLGALNPSADGQAIVTIVDPVAGTSYVLDGSTHTAYRSRMARVERERRAGGVPPPPPPPPPPPGERRILQLPSGAPSAPEPLGTRQIEGVSAPGTKRTETLPTGRIGNDRPIVVTDERWDSPDLKVLVFSRHHDPRTGDVEYRLTNLRRDEPPPDLFTVPADYTYVDAPPPPPPPPAPPRKPE
jgi:hypothetical protein